VPPELEPELDPELEPEEDPELEPELLPELEPEEDPELEPELVELPELDPELEPELLPELEPELDPELEPLVLPEDPELLPELEPEEDEDPGPPEPVSPLQPAKAREAPNVATNRATGRRAFMERPHSNRRASPLVTASRHDVAPPRCTRPRGAVSWIKRGPGGEARRGERPTGGSEMARRMHLTAA